MNTNVEDSSNVQYQKIQLEDSTKNKYPVLHYPRIPFIPNLMSTILHEIFKLSEKFPKTNILSIKYFCGTQSTVTSIPK